MRHRVGERFQLVVGGLEFQRVLTLGLVERPDFFLGFLALSNVARNLAEAAKLAVGAVHRREDHVSPKLGTVLAHPPPFALEAAILPRHFQLAGGLARLDIFGRRKATVMLTDDFCGSVSLDTLRTFVPAYDPALRIQHQDRIVLDALNQQPKAFLALQHFLFGQLARSNVADRAANQRFFPSLDWAKADLDREFSAILAQTIEFQAGTHRTHSRVDEVSSAMRRMLVAEPRRHQHLDRIAK